MSMFLYRDPDFCDFLRDDFESDFLTRFDREPPREALFRFFDRFRIVRLDFFDAWRERWLELAVWVRDRSFRLGWRW